MPTFVSMNGLPAATQRASAETRAQMSSAVRGPEVSVVIPTLDTRRLLANCLSSVVRQRGLSDLTVVVVDNGSQDGTADMVRAHFPDVRLIVSDVNRGYSGGVNLGLSAAPLADLTVILNSDTIVHEGAFTEMCDHLAALADVGAASPRIVDAEGELQSCGHVRWRLRDFVLVDVLGRSVAEPVRHPETSSYVGRPSGACLCLTRRGREVVGRFDESLVIYYEEEDIARRLERQGLRCYYVASARVTHFGQGTTSQLDSRGISAATHRSRAHFWTSSFGILGVGLRLLAAMRSVLSIALSLIALAPQPRAPSPREELRAHYDALRAYLGLSGRDASARALKRPWAESGHTSAPAEPAAALEWLSVRTCALARERSIPKRRRAEPNGSRKGREKSD